MTYRRELSDLYQLVQKWQFGHFEETGRERIILRVLCKIIIFYRERLGELVWLGEAERTWWGLLADLVKITEMKLPTPSIIEIRKFWRDRLNELIFTSCQLYRNNYTTINKGFCHKSSNWCSYSLRILLNVRRDELFPLRISEQSCNQYWGHLSKSANWSIQNTKQR